MVKQNCGGGGDDKGAMTARSLFNCRTGSILGGWGTDGTLQSVNKGL